MTEPGRWHKSSASESSNCVEIRMDATGVWVRDSHDLEVSPLHFSYGEWRAFITGVKRGEFDPGNTG
jgi:hypothetical protein